MPFFLHQMRPSGYTGSLVALTIMSGVASLMPLDPVSAADKPPTPIAVQREKNAAEDNRREAETRAHDQAVAADMEATLRRAGFSDLQVMPNAVLVRGKDKAGNPVAMALSPGSMTEMVTLDPHAVGNPAARSAPLTGSSAFVAVLPGERLATKLVGASVVGSDGAAVGTVADLAIDGAGVHAFIIKTGGVLGLGARYVAIAPAALAIAGEPGAAPTLAIKATAAQLAAAPTFSFDALAKTRD